jgi:probable HAF family extracellular repeat protein
MTDTGSLGGAISTQAQAINRSGTIVGTSYIDVGRPRAFVAANGQLRDIGDLGGGTSVANGINDKGQIVGSSGVGVVNGNTVSHAFLYSDGRMQDLGTIGADPVSTATGINRRGQVVGYTYDPATGGQRAFIYQNGKMTDLSSLGAYAAYAINDDGTVVGDGNGGGFIYSSSNGSISFIPGFSPRAINSKGTIVGAGFFGGSAAIYENGTLSDLNAGSLVDRPAGIDKLGQALGINDNGEIVGAARFFDANGVGATRAFLLVPTAQK